MAITLTKNTKETVPVEVIDYTEVVTDISGLSPKFDFLKDDNSTVYSAQAATASGMIISCLIDTSASGPGGSLAVGHYRLFVSFTVGSEIPRLGPVDVYIKDTTA